ncbi:MAG: nuclear transport factor 2 family protein [Caulobacteraceae bacterium]
MRPAPWIIAGIALAASGGAHAAPNYDKGYDSLIAVERQFAADADALGITPAFKKHIAPDGVIFRPDPVLGTGALALQTDPPGQKLDWWPAFAGLAKSGDMGFNLGPFYVPAANRYGYFVTVWGKQPNGEWKFLIDRGPRPQGVPTYKKEGPVGRLPVYSGRSIPHAEQALARVREFENSMADGLQTNVKATFLNYLADDAWVMGSKEQPKPGRDFFMGELDRRPAKAFMQPVGGGQSRAGDLVYTYGYMTWADDKGATIPGHYLRVWQRRGDTWKIVVDEFVSPAAPPRAAP